MCSSKNLLHTHTHLCPTLTTLRDVFNVLSSLRIMTTTAATETRAAAATMVTAAAAATTATATLTTEFHNRKPITNHAKLLA